MNSKLQGELKYAREDSHCITVLENAMRSSLERFTHVYSKKNQADNVQFSLDKMAESVLQGREGVWKGCTTYASRLLKLVEQCCLDNLRTSIHSNTKCVCYNVTQERIA